MSALVNLDGQIVNSNTIDLINNRAFNYGDGLFETMRFMNRRVQFVDEHYRRLTKGMAVLGLNTPDYFSASYFDDQVKELIDLLDYSGSCRIKLMVFRQEGGYFSPANNDVSFIINCFLMVASSYELNEGGHNIGVYDEITLSKNSLSNIKHLNCLPNVLAGIYCRKNKLEDCLLINDDWQIVEGISSNVFIVQGDEIVTPPLEVGCVAGTIRGVIINLAKESGIKFREGNITPEDLESADEVFLTNAITGIRWVGAFNKKRYFNTKAKILNMLLNKKSLG